MKKQVKVVEKPLTTLFLEKDKRSEIGNLLKRTKELYLSYDKDSAKRYRLRLLSLDMWNSMQNEFYATADISDNTVWKWQDAIESYDETGYLLVNNQPEELSSWSKLLISWVHREWSIEVLKLIKDFNLDNQPGDYVTAFQNDFKRVKDKASFCGALLKWTDMIMWSPWKLSLLDNTYQQPLNEHYDCEFNAEYEESEHEFY